MHKVLKIGVILNFILAPSVFADSEKSDRIPSELEKYERTGEVESCLRLRNIASTRVLDSRHILFKMNNGDVFVNKLPHRCGFLRRNSAFMHKTSGSRLCSVETITVIEPNGLSGGACGLGSFHELEIRES